VPRARGPGLGPRPAVLGDVVARAGRHGPAVAGHRFHRRRRGRPEAQLDRARGPHQRQDQEESGQAEEVRQASPPSPNLTLTNITQPNPSYLSLSYH